jgi:phage terminase large subunit-like protein
MARKNGKSTLASGVGLYLFDADSEPGAEVYTGATKREQAKIIHSEATRMVRKSPALRKRIAVNKDNLHSEATASKYEPLGRDSNTLDGLNVHGAIIDELHAHKTRDLYDVLDTATGSRRQPLIYSITTAGFNRTTICYEQHEYTCKILERVIEDDTFFGIIFALDENDDWEDEANWIKANPNLGVSVKLDDLQRKADKAREMPAALNAFLRLHLTLWTQAETKWMDADKWRACGDVEIDPGEMLGRTCYGGLDLSSSIDISAFILVFPPEEENELYLVLCFFWIPEEAMRERTKRDRVPYEAWVREKYIEATPGNVIDYDWIIAGIQRQAELFDLAEIAFDPWGATKMIQSLQNEGFTVVPFRQGVASMSGPMKELERLIAARGLAHGGNPVLAWMADNLVAREDPAGNIKPDKSKSFEKIDGIVALIMGLDRAIRNEGQDEDSIYEEQDIKIL